MTAPACDAYLASRTGTFERRAVRYRRALDALREHGLADEHTLFDIGAGWTELDVVLRCEGEWRGRYIPVDFGTCGSDLESWVPCGHGSPCAGCQRAAHWVPHRPADFAVALEVLEHLDDPWRLVTELQRAVPVIIVSVPDPATVDVLGIDDTHRTIITRDDLEAHGFTVTSELFYGGHYSNGANDALFGVWVSA